MDAWSIYADSPWGSAISPTISPAPSWKPEDSGHDYTLDCDEPDYRETQPYYFVSPSGNLLCGYYPDQPELGMGCQAAVLVANMPECNDPDSLAGSATIPLDDAQPVKAQCVNQGFYVGEHRRALPYGSAIEVDGYRCESTTEHMACKKVGSTRGFTIAREAIHITQ